ncbi:30S ribosomal protein S17 [archaeon]|jgi:small subunit ribosomal protein S17|nr:30S ribosomal protein S17 [archaeon]|tara:strand:+ start:14505 stop:14936 length:432 start_codon:yes stop_codon:yes gene_type:complete
MTAEKISGKENKDKGKCEDSNCPVHGRLKCRGRSFTGTVISTRMQKTAVVEWERRNYLRKYERFEKRRSKVMAHNTVCINAKEGDIVKIMECRPLSKSKNFVIVEVLGKERLFKERMEAEEESKVKKDDKKSDDKKVESEEAE